MTRNIRGAMSTREALLPFVIALAAMAGLAAQTTPVKPAQLVTVKIKSPPALDGRGNDPAWRKARPVTVTAKGVTPRDPWRLDASGAARRVHGYSRVSGRHLG